MPSTEEQYRALERRVRQDMIIDTIGNLLLCLGIYAWLKDPSWIHPLLNTQEFIIGATATGILNLFHLPARLRRLKAYLTLKQQR